MLTKGGYKTKLALFPVHSAGTAGHHSASGGGEVRLHTYSTVSGAGYVKKHTHPSRIRPD